MTSNARRDAGVSTRACAKINLTLRVLGRRPDGYHEVRTVLQTLAFHDTLTFLPADGRFRIECSDPACPVDRTNLVWRAADRIWRAAGRRGTPRGVLVRIEKRIPLGSGLGGGSSDAAAAIRVLSRLWRVDLSSESRHAIAVSIGADVPFFLNGGTALGVDRGDLIVPLADMPPAWVTVIVPSFGVSTKDAYGWWDRDEGRRQKAEGRRQRAEGRRRLLRFLPVEALKNDLEGPVAARHPEIARIVRALVRAGASHAAMSGSGSAVFGLFSSRAAATAAASLFRLPTEEILMGKTVVGKTVIGETVRGKTVIRKIVIEKTVIEKTVIEKTIVTETITRRRHAGLARPR